MSRNGSLLPIPPDSNLGRVIRDLIDSWDNEQWRWPDRKDWERAVQVVLEGAYPDSSAADRALTARELAP